MDLMDVSLTLLVPTNLCREQQRMSYSSGYQNALYSVVRHNTQALLLEEGKEDCLDLDNTIVWRQIKVKQKAIQLFRLLEGQAVEAKILRIGLKTLIRWICLQRTNGKSLPCVAQCWVFSGHVICSDQPNDHLVSVVANDQGKWIQMAD